MSARIHVASGCLIVALIGGALLSWNSISGLRQTAATEKAQDEKSMARLQAENQRLKGDRPTAVSVGSNPGKEALKPPRGVQRIEALGFLTDLEKRGFFATPDPAIFLRQRASVFLSPDSSPNLKLAPEPAYMINAAGELGPGFADFFGLNEDERTALESGFSSLKDEIERAIQANATITRTDDVSIVLTVKPVDGAANYRDRFTALFQGVLGPDRYREFVTLNSPQRDIGTAPLPAALTGNLNFFGEATGTYTLKHTPTSYSSSDSIKAGESQQSGSSGGGTALSSETFRDMMIKSRGVVMKLLPADF